MFRLITFITFVLLPANAHGDAPTQAADVRDLTRVRAYERARVELIEQIRPATA